MDRRNCREQAKSATINGARQRRSLLEQRRSGRPKPLSQSKVF
jgi:hypothetical protein